MKPIRIGSASRIEIGYDGENGARAVVFDATKWMEEMPGCTAAITAQRADGKEYIAPEVTQDEEKKTITWTLTSAETMEGEGRAQLLWMDGKRIAKQAIFTTVCHESLKSDATEIGVPEPVWAQKSLAAARKAEADAGRAEAAATRAEAAEEAVYAPAASAARVEGGVLVTVTDKTGTTSAVIRDGERGETGPQGEQGPKGEPGPQGIQGPAGADGKETVIDKTLTQAGQAADAAKTGEAIGKLKNDLMQLKNGGVGVENTNFLNYTLYKNLVRNASVNVSGDFLSDHDTADVDDVATTSLLYKAKRYVFDCEQKHSYLFLVKTKVTNNAKMSQVLINGFYSSTSNAIGTIDISSVVYPTYTANENNTTEYKTIGVLFYFDNPSYNTGTFAITLNNQSNSATIYVKDVMCFDVTGLKLDEIKRIKNVGYIYDKYSNDISFKNVENKAINISCIGDSLTFGIGSSNPYKSGGDGYVPNLNNRVSANNEDVSFYNFGVAGEPSKYIAERVGGLSVFVKPFTIPSSKDESIQIELVDIIGNPCTIGKTTGTNGKYLYYGVNPCSIGGIIGNIEYSNGVYTFNRITSGESIVISELTELKTDIMLTHKNDIAIIWAGTNDGLGNDIGYVSDRTFNYIDNMINSIGTDKYIIVGMTAKVIMPNLQQIRELFQNKYGNHYFDSSYFLCEYGLSDNNITPSEQDNTDLSNGEIPNSLRSDTIHLNDYGYNTMAKWLHWFGRSLGYWN